MIIQEVLNKTIQFFKDKKFDTARLDAEILISEALGLQRIDLYTQFTKPMSEAEVTKCRDFVKRRTSGEPVSYIIGKKSFYKHDFFVNQNVLIPRPETEHIIEEVIKFFTDKEKELSILDIGTGSGILACSLAFEYPNSKVKAIDKSVGAIEVARINSEKLNLNQKIEIIHQDASEDKILEILSNDQFDMIVSNPPYISQNDPDIEINVKKFEPESALFAEGVGMFFISDWAQKFSKKLKPQGLMIFEIGHKQGLLAMEGFKNLNLFNHIEIVKDLSGKDRFIKGIKNG